MLLHHLRQHGFAEALAQGHGVGGTQAHLVGGDGGDVGGVY